MAAEGRSRAAGLALACFAAFALVAWQVARQGPLTGFDQAVLGWFVAHRSEALTQAMLLVSGLHKTVPVLVAAAMLAAWQALRHRRAIAWRLLLLIAGGMFLNFGVKQVFQRGRPETEEALVHLASFSFPSGHAAAATVLYAGLCGLAFNRTRSCWWRVLAVAGACAMIALVATSRMYLGAHYFSDVVGGVLLASAWVALVQGVLR